MIKIQTFVSKFKFNWVHGKLHNDNHLEGHVNKLK